jgi:hypothetical protein
MHSSSLIEQEDIWFSIGQQYIPRSHKLDLFKCFIQNKTKYDMACVFSSSSSN